MATTKYLRRQRIRRGIRKKVAGTAARPRLSVFRSNNEIYAQLVNDDLGQTLASATSLKLDKSGKNKTDLSKAVGAELASQAKKSGIETVVFDRGGYLFHGRVKALAEGAREAGLKF